MESVANAGAREACIPGGEELKAVRKGHATAAAARPSKGSSPVGPCASAAARIKPDHDWNTGASSITPSLAGVSWGSNGRPAAASRKGQRIGGGHTEQQQLSAAQQSVQATSTHAKSIEGGCTRDLRVVRAEKVSTL